MKSTALLMLTQCMAACVIAASPYTTPPGGSATGVPSSTQSGLVPNRPAGTGGGTVFLRDSGGRSFRGVVPYGSSFYYDRSSGGSLQRLSSSPSPSVVTGGSSYYDPRTGVRVELSKPSTSGSNPMVNPYAPVNLPQLSNTQYGPQPRPISSRPEDLTRELDRRITPNLMRDKAEPEADINALAREAQQNKDMQVDPELLLPKTQDSEINSNLKGESAEPQQTPDMYEQMKNKTVEKILENQADAVKKEAEQAAQAAKATTIKIPEYKSIFGVEPESDSDSESKSGSRSQSSQKGARQGISSPLEAKVVDYFAAAEEYLNQGRFYKAADTYALAAAWQPENALAYAGQAWALFAAGEYMSSAYYLNRSIAVEPKIAERKVNISAFLKDRDIFENRLIEMTSWQRNSQSGEMAFLLAYVLWQDGKALRAEEMIRVAAELMPQDDAVKTLLKAITSPASSDVSSPQPTTAEPNEPAS